MFFYSLGLLVKHVLPLVPWILIVLVLLLKRNRRDRGASLLIPAVFFWGLATAVGHLFDRTIFGRDDTVLYTATLPSILVGMSTLWALSYLLEGKRRLSRFLLAVAIFALTGAWSSLFFARLKWLFVAGSAVLTLAACTVILPAMVFSAWKCGGRFRPVRFTLWILPFCILMAMPWVYPFDKATGVIRWTGHLLGVSRTGWQWFHTWLVGGIFGVELGLGCYVMSLPFVIFAFLSRPFRARLGAIVGMHEQASDLPRSMGLPKILLASFALIAGLLMGLATDFKEKPKSIARSQPSPQDLTFTLTPLQGVMGSLVNYYRPMSAELSRWPEEKITALPDLQSKTPLFAALQIGTGSDKRVTVLLDEPAGKEARMFIDLNNDEDLSNDGPGAWTRSSEDSLGLSDAMLQVEYDSGVIPYTLDFYRFNKRLREVVLYYRNAGREGTVKLGDQSYQVAILDENADGSFSDIENGTLILDLNQDGKLQGDSDSAESYPMSKPFNVNGQVWQVTAMSPDGTSLSIGPSQAKVDMKTYIDVGYPAPAFVGKGLQDEEIDLQKEASLGQCVLLDFWASWCGPCRGEFPTLKALREQYADKGLRIIGINLDEKKEDALKAVQENSLEYPHVFDGKGWRNAVAALYRVNGIPATFLLDKNLNIVAKDLRGEDLIGRVGEMLKTGDTPANPAGN